MKKLMVSVALLAVALAATAQAVNPKPTNPPVAAKSIDLAQFKLDPKFVQSFCGPFATGQADLPVGYSVDVERVLRYGDTLNLTVVKSFLNMYAANCNTQPED